MELSNVSSSTNTSAPAQIASSLPLSMVMVLELACITVILGNLLVILAFCSYRQRTAPDILILSLSLADFLDSGIALQMVVFIKYLLRFPWTQRSCDSFIVLLYTFRTASASTVTFMAAERALLLVYPIRHRTMVTIPRTSKLILAIWVFSLVCGGLSFIGVGHSSFHKHEKACPYQLYDIGIEYAILFEVLGGLMLLVTLLSFIAIKVSGRKFLRRQSMMKMPLRKVSKQALCEEYSSRSRGRGGSRAHETAGMTSVRRLTLMMAIVVVVFFVSWMPFLALLPANFASASLCYQQLNNLASLITKRPPRTTISLAASMASFLHAVVNPLLYGKMSKRYRRGYIYVMKQIVAFFCGRKSSHVPSVYFSNTAHVTSQTAADNTGYIVGTDSNGNTGVPHSVQALKATHFLVTHSVQALLPANFASASLCYQQLNNLASLITKRPPRTTISLAASMASFLHAVVNPLLYGKMSKRYRRGYIYVMKQIVAFFCGRKSSHVPSVYFSNTAHVTSQTAADNTGYIVGTDSNGNTGDIITSLSNRRYSSEGTEQISTGVINNYDTKHTSKDDIARISCDSPTALVDGACILDGIIPAATRDIDLRSHVSISIL
ncbi:predicted protein [Nematostella vectensis]|uniref:Thyrotropin-releasing hormone receptor n=1 Tax=Nematostella vectensis TaxID=45351 RepID=A7S074_NEMVE|nr:predicted protein [Nematostella vectensis]|eukprot:XP_001634974.1 predicted protein [Nematostella vectensis]